MSFIKSLGIALAFTVLAFIITLISAGVYNLVTYNEVTISWMLVSYLINIIIVITIGLEARIRQIKEDCELDIRILKNDAIRLHKAIKTNGPFKVHDQVTKVSGYKYPGEIASSFTNRKGDVRYVVESTSKDTEGMLHIFSPENLVLVSPAGYNLD